MKIIMKNTIKFIAFISLTAFALFSCAKNDPAKFDDANAFVSFDNAEISVSEDAEESIKIPVTLASVAGLSQSVKFELSSPEEKGAKEGVNYELVTSSGVLSFDAQNRTQYIEIKPKYDGVYTGDLKLTIKLDESASLNTGDANTCTVTINDIDHPLVSILGTYTCSGKHVSKGNITWTMTIKKDADDDHMVWIDDIFGNPGWAGDDMMYYGNVDANLTTITVPFGQQAAYKYQSHPVYFYGLTGTNISDASIIEAGSLTISITKDASGKVNLNFGKYGCYLYIDTLGYASAILPVITAVKD